MTATRTPPTMLAVPIGELAEGRRFKVAGLGDRRGVLLRLTDISAIVCYDKRAGERRKPVTVSLATRVIPL